MIPQPPLSNGERVKKKSHPLRRMALDKSMVPPLVLTRSGNAGRAFHAPLSL
jgi:hypothetical protein